MTTTDHNRIITLDALRGFAVMGILAMNIIAFAMPQMAYVTPTAHGSLTSADQLSWLLSHVVFDGKMRGLFSLLFGASMMLIIEAADARGDDPAGIHFRRMAWLGLFGLAHFFFVWFGDILFLYAVVGAIAFFARHWSPRLLIMRALMLFGVGMIIWSIFYGGLFVLQKAAMGPGADPENIKNYAELMSEFSSQQTVDLALHRGGYAAIVSARLADWADPLQLIVQSICETLPLMWLGMALKKNGFLAGAWDRAEYRRWAMRLVPLGLLLNLATGVITMASGYDPVITLNIFMAWSLVPHLMLTIGYAALLVLLIERLAGTPLLARVAAAGQAAFTNYLGTSIVMTTIFYGYGLGMFGYVGRPALWLFVLGAWAVMLLWSKPWLVRFRFGPMEWLWRSLARGGVQPFRR